MTQESPVSYRSMVDMENGTIEREIFSDEEIYRRELQQIFARAWNFMCHESQIPKRGDFFLSYIGEESVIATRDKSGKLQVFLNSCRHRGNAVCRAEQGNTRAFLCTYHGWTYDLEGNLTGVPGYQSLYHGELDRSKWGLVRAGKVASYKGFVFATMDPDAPDLEEYLGPVGRLALDICNGRGKTIKAVNGVPKNQIGCNWKMAVDNSFDFYHGAISHASALRAGFNRRPEVLNGEPGFSEVLPLTKHRVLLGEYGHAAGGPKITPEAWQAIARAKELGAPPDLTTDEHWRNEADGIELLGDLRDTRGHFNIFPNLWVYATGLQVCLRLPKGPNKTELWWFGVFPEEFTDEQRDFWLSTVNHTFGPAGMLEQEDGENWDQSTRAMKGPIASKYPANFQMNLGLGEVKHSANGAGVIDTNVSEHAQLWTWQSWADWMEAEDWAALKADHHRVPDEGARL